MKQVFSIRSDLIFNKTVFNPISIATKSDELVEDYNEANHKCTRPPDNRPYSLWTPPEARTVKINSNASCFPGGSTSWGFVVRDHDDNVLL